jgi:hypothetical protein
MLHLADVLDVAAARSLGAALAARVKGEGLVVDCRDVRTVEDRALATLAAALRAAAGEVSLLGLGEHPWRVLRYLGVEPAPHAEGDGDGDEGGAVPVDGGAVRPQALAGGPPPAHGD